MRSEVLELKMLQRTIPEHLYEHPYEHPKEREIDRAVLVDVAPDREELLTSGKSNAELRAALKIRVGASGTHWLHQRRVRTKANFKDATARLSTFIRDTSGRDSERAEQDEGHGSPAEYMHVVRRVCSASSVFPLNSIGNVARQHQLQQFQISTELVMLDVWGTPRLSTADKLISPRPLGPTHILIVHEKKDLQLSLNSHHHHLDYLERAGAGPRRRSASQSAHAPNSIELPVNDLLFLLGLPNLAATPPNRGGAPALPRRLHKELPRVAMYVPHLATFPELVVYLHTLNQAELMRSVVPEWIRDVVHPLVHLNSSSISTFADDAEVKEDALAGVVDCNNAGAAWRPKTIFQLFSTSRSCCSSPTSTTAPSSTSSSSVHLPTSQEPESTTSLDLVAHELAQLVHSGDYEAGEPDVGLDPLVDTMSLVNALRDNVEYMGYFGHELWTELDLFREVLIRAISSTAKL